MFDPERLPFLSKLIDFVEVYKKFLFDLYNSYARIS